MLLPRPLNSYKYITETKDVLFVLFGFHINMDISHINSKKGKTKMNLKKLNQEIHSFEFIEKKTIESNESSKSIHRSADYLIELLAHL